MALIICRYKADLKIWLFAGELGHEFYVKPQIFQIKEASLTNGNFMHRKIPDAINFTSLSVNVFSIV